MSQMTQRKENAAAAPKAAPAPAAAETKKADAPPADEDFVASRSGVTDGKSGYHLIGSVTAATGETALTLDGQYLTGTIMPNAAGIAKLDPTVRKAVREVVGELQGHAATIADKRVQASVAAELASMSRAAGR